MAHIGFVSTVDVKPEDGFATPPSSVSVSGLPFVDRGSYHIVGEFAKGGIGRILRARDPYLDRPVALKELLAGGGEAEERFLREALVTARLQHPSIVPIYEAGRWPTGEPFYAMKLVSGRPLIDAIERAPTLVERLALLPHILAVAEAMAYAHGERIIHRDLKPQNILLGEFGETIVIDWGLAKSLAPEPREEGARAQGAAGIEPSHEGAGLTVAGAIMGTPLYMAPEQASGLSVDERADVYALGAILYHVLAGTPAYEGHSVPEILTKVMSEPPVPLEKRTQGIPTDLLAIVQKAMCPQVEGRYRTAKELAEDLRRFQTGQIVNARTYSVRERVRRFAMRHRAVLSVAAAALLLLTVGGSISIVGIVDARRHAEGKQRDAEAAEQRATARADDLTLLKARDSLAHDPHASLAWLTGLSPAFRHWGAARIVAADAISRGIPTVFREHSAAVGGIAFSPDGALLVSVGDDRKVVARNLQTGKTYAFSSHADEAWVIAFSPDGKLLATGGKDNLVRLRDLAMDTERILEGHQAGVTHLAFSPNGKRLATLGGREQVMLWDIITGKGRSIARTRSTRGAQFSPDGKTLVIVDETGLAQLDLESNEMRTFPDPDPLINDLTFSPDGKYIATAGRNGAVKLWNMANGASELLYQHTEGLVRGVGFSAGGAHVVSIGYDAMVKIWSTATKTLQISTGHTGYIRNMFVSHNGKKVVTAGGDGAVRFWDIATGESRVFQGFRDGVAWVGMSPDDSMIAAGGVDGTVRLWRLGSNAIGLATLGTFSQAAFSRDGRRVATRGGDGLLRVTTLSRGDDQTTSIVLPGPPAKPSTLPPRVAPLPALQFSANGERIASADDDGTVRVFPAGGGESQVFQGHQGQVSSIAFSPHGNQIVSGGKDGTVRIWNIAQAEGRTLWRHDAAVTIVAFSPDGKTLASGSVDGHVRISAKTLDTGVELFQHQGSVVSLVFSPDGGTLVSGGSDRAIRLAHLANGKVTVREDAVHGLRHIVFLPDGKTFLSLGASTALQLWDAQTGESRSLFRGHTAGVTEAAVATDGQRIVTASADGTVRLWDVATGASRVLGSCSSDGAVVAFGPDGRSVAAASFDGAVKHWADDLPTDPAGLRVWLKQSAPDPIDPLLAASQAP